MPHLDHLPPIEDLVPHRGTMLLLDKVTQFENDSLTAEYTPRPDAWYADHEGTMPGWIGIELMAQAIAAHVGLMKHMDHLPIKQGVLLGTRRYNSKVSHFAANTPLQVMVTLIFSDESGLGAYECQIRSETDTLATAALKVYEPDDLDAFLKKAAND